MMQDDVGNFRVSATIRRPDAKICILIMARKPKIALIGRNYGVILKTGSVVRTLDLEAAFVIGIVRPRDIAIAPHDLQARGRGRDGWGMLFSGYEPVAGINIFLRWIGRSKTVRRGRGQRSCPKPILYTLGSVAKSTQSCYSSTKNANRE